MDTETKIALLASIEKWKLNAVAETPTEYVTGSASCPLCDLYNNCFNNTAFCSGCPVFDAGGGVWCFNTPYMVAEDEREKWYREYRDGDDRRREACQSAARKETLFLQSLVEAE